MRCRSTCISRDIAPALSARNGPTGIRTDLAPSTPISTIFGVSGFRQHPIYLAASPTMWHELKVIVEALDSWSGEDLTVIMLQEGSVTGFLQSTVAPVHGRLNHSLGDAS